MEQLLGLLGIGTAGSFIYLLLWWRFQERGRVWREAANAAGLVNIRTELFLGWDSKLMGEVGTGPLQVRIESYTRSKEDHGTRIVVGGLRHGSFALTIRPEGITTRIEKAFGEKELEVGDEPFDSAAFMQGSTALVRAVFNAETRGALRELLEGRLWVEHAEGGREFRARTHLSDNQLIVEIREPLFSSFLPCVPAALKQLVKLGQQLARPEDLAERIAINAKEDPVPGVRIANLITLASEFPTHAATRPAQQQALADPAAEVRLRAAITLGPDGRSILLELAQRHDTPENIAVRAIAALGTDFPPDRLLSLLREAAGAGRMSVAKACADMVGRNGRLEGVTDLCRVLMSTRSELAVAAAEALGMLGSATAEPSLIAALESETEEVRTAAAAALARCGSSHSVQPLRHCAGAHPLDGSLRRATRQAIAEIQARLTGASPGQLSLAEETTGRISLAEEDQRGRLSLDNSHHL